MSRTIKAVTKAVQPQVKQGKLTWKERLFPEEYDQLKNIFSLFDEDNSGFIDPEEINKIMDELGDTGRKGNIAYEMICQLRDFNRPINFQDFLEFAATRVGDVKTKEGLGRLFRHADKEDDELLDFEELKSLCRMAGDNLTDDDIMEMMHTIHINRNTGTSEGVSFEDFYNIVTGYNKN